MHIYSKFKLIVFLLFAFWGVLGSWWVWMQICNVKNSKRINPLSLNHHLSFLFQICSNHHISSLTYGNSLSCAALDIDHCDLECEYNNVEHRTDLNGIDRLIVRRGQAFSIKLYLRSGSYQPGVSALDCIAETGASPSALRSDNSGAVVLFSLKTWKWTL